MAMTLGSTIAKYRCAPILFILLMYGRSVISSACQDPCTGGVGCVNDGPQAFTSAITGFGRFSYAWEDPANVTSVDLYQIDMTVDDGGISCSGVSVGSSCTLLIPGQGITNGFCDSSTASKTLCWIPSYLDIPWAFPWAKPCNRATDQSCNTGAYTGVPAVHYYLRLSAGRCCFYGALSTPGCETCPLSNQDACPKSEFSTTDIVAMGKRIIILCQSC
jgi:hypothetical protein